MLGELLVLFLATAPGGVVSFEGNTFPETVGWERILGGAVGADRSIENGSFVERLTLPPGQLGNGEFYNHAIPDIGQPFFMEWRVQTDASPSLLDSFSTPVAIAAADHGVDYRFVITNGRVEFDRSNFIPWVYVNVTPNEPHSYRFEVSGANSFAWYIDGVLSDSGTPTIAFPQDDALVGFGVRRYGVDMTTSWDYIRFGTVPEPTTVCLLTFGAAFLALRRRSTHS